ncbi:MAG: class I SAM-dependent methyltransferase, partial [Chloroflexota bacterium]
MVTVDWHARFTQQAGWSAGLRSYLFGRAGLPPHARLLEVGCGTGAVLADLRLPHDPAAPGASGRPAPPPAQAPSGGGLHCGLDLQFGFLQQARRHAPAARLLQGDAFRLPFRDGAFDLVICHFLLLWLPDPPAALAEMRRAARPGGWVMALAEPDYAARIDHPPELARLGELQRQALIEQGARPDIGRRLRALFAGAGLEQVEGGVLGGQCPAGSPSEQEQALE